jgi:hypothetical protein
MNFVHKWLIGDVRFDVSRIGSSCHRRIENNEIPAISGGTLSGAERKRIRSENYSSEASRKDAL